MTNDFIRRATTLLNLVDYSDISTPFSTGINSAVFPNEEQYILRMMIRNNESNQFYIPDELKWLENEIIRADMIQKYYNLDNQFVYVTVRHGIVKSITDDEWHVDGFSMRIPHVPEQNYICSVGVPTEYLEQSFEIPQEFDPNIHNLHHLLQDMADPNKIKSLTSNEIYLIDPYCVHRRPTVDQGTFRSFYRISFIPIEIEDDSCTQNPLLPKKNYNRTDIRKSLKRFNNSN